MKNKQDPALDVPAEANTDKHINFLKEQEEAAGIKTKDSKKFKEQMKQPKKEKKPGE